MIFKLGGWQAALNNIAAHSSGISLVLIVDSFADFDSKKAYFWAYRCNGQGHRLQLKSRIAQTRYAETGDFPNDNNPV